MIHTSELYKTLLNQGAIQEYKIVVDGVEYIEESIYDRINLKQKLFSTDTFSVGGLALALLEVKLKIPTVEIPRNANIKFYYRLTNMEEQSEWIQKFNGRVTRRKRYTDDVTIIEAVSNGANYDKFLDVFQNELVEYPANNRTVVNMCAEHLGLTVENINAIYDDNNVEFPNELTIIEVLQNIAALSGGNWIITESDELRLVVLKAEENIIGTYSAFNIVSEESIAPISKITMYYQDDKAFSSGDDTGSELTIDCMWATQDTTDYVLSLYKGYVYKPIQGVGVAIDGALQLGDSYLYEDGQTQLATVIDYTFDGYLSANIDAPLSNEVNYDDPYEMIKNAQLKRKVTLGDNYQGVTISRDKGIEMVYSPDGSEEHASGKFYANLEKGMAFQYKDEVTGVWEDWLYFDKNENRFKLMLKGGDLDEQMVNIVVELNKIMQEIENIHNGNLIYNLNGNDDLVGWEGMADISGISYSENLTYRDVDTYYDGEGEKEGLRYPDGLLMFNGLTYGMNAMPIELPDSLSGVGLSFFGKSEMKSPFATLAVNGEYSFRAKIIDFKETIIKVYEYVEVPSIGTQHEYVSTYMFSDPSEFIEITLTPQSSTNYIKIGITVPEATLDDRVVFTEMMFNYGLPQTWFQSADDAMAYAKSNITQLANRVDIQTEEIDLINGDLHNAGIEINAREGVTTRGSKFRVLSADGYETYMEVNENGLFVKDATIEGNLSAGTIAGLLFEGSRVMFPDGNLALDSKENSIMFGSTKMKFEQSIYDIQGEQFYSDEVVIQTTNGEIRFGDSTGIISPAPITMMSGVDIIQSKIILHPEGVMIGSIHGGMPNYFGGDFMPTTNNVFNIGGTSNRVKTIYLGSQPNISSDSRLKRNILPIDDKLIDIFAKEVKPKTYTTLDSDEIHFGYVAQDVQQAIYKYTLSKHGLNAAKEEQLKFAVLSKSNDYLALLYGEIGVMMDAYNRKKIDEFEDRLTRLERMMLDENN